MDYLTDQNSIYVVSIKYLLRIRLCFTNDKGLGGQCLGRLLVGMDFACIFHGVDRKIKECWSIGLTNCISIVFIF